VPIGNSFHSLHDSGSISSSEHVGEKARTSI
jgi:hypothetical protein